MPEIIQTVYENKIVELSDQQPVNDFQTEMTAQNQDGFNFAYMASLSNGRTMLVFTKVTMTQVEV